MGRLEGEVDAGPRHPHRTVEHGFVGRRGDASGGELGLVVRGGRAVEAEHRVDRRDAQADVPHVGRGAERVLTVVWLAGRATLLDGRETSSESLRIGPVEGQGVLVVEELRVRRGVHDDVVRAPGGHRAGFEDLLHPRFEFLELGHRARTHIEFRDRVIRHDVRCVATLHDDAVDTVGRFDVLTEQADADLRNRDRISGVDAGLRKGTRVGRPTVVVNVEVAYRQAVHAVGLGRRGVDHHRRVEAVEDTGVEHLDLAATAFLGRRAEDRDGDAEIVGQRGKRMSGADRGGRDDVVSAGMADAGEGVVLGADAEVQRPASGRGGEGGVQPGNAVIDREAGVGVEQVGDHAGAQVLLVGRLRVGMHAVAEGEQPSPGLIDDRTGGVLGLHGGDHRPIVGRRGLTP